MAAPRIRRQNGSLDLRSFRYARFTYPFPFTPSTTNGIAGRLSSSDPRPGTPTTTIFGGV